MLKIILKLQKNVSELDMLRTIEENNGKTYFSFKDISLDNISIYNKKGYNIYETLNDFIGNKRVLSDIDNLRRILVDYDSNDRDTLFRNLQILQDKYGIYPREINKTFKGYHVLFYLNNDLYRMKIDQYEKLAKYIVNFLCGDKRALQTTGIYKVPGYYDNYENRQFLIQNEYSNFSGLNDISIKVCESLINEKVKLRKGKGRKYALKENYTNFISVLNKMGFNEIIIPNLKKYGINIEINSDNNVVVNGNLQSINTGIKYNANGDYINDFSHGKGMENRANGNYNFLFRYIFREDIKKFFFFCKNFLGISSTSENKMLLPLTLVKAFNNTSNTENCSLFTNSHEEIEILSYNNGINFLEEKTKQDIKSINEILSSNELEIDGKKTFDQLYNSNAIQHVLYGINHYIRVKKIQYNDNAEYEIPVNSFLGFLGLSVSNNNRKNLFEMLLKLSCLSINKKITREINGVKRSGYIFKKPLEIKGVLPESNLGEMILLLDVMKEDENGFINVNDKILTLNKNPLGENNNKLKVSFIILEKLNEVQLINGGVKFFKYNTLKDLLGINFSRERNNVSYINEFLDELISNNIIGGYEHVKNDDKYGNIFKILANNYKKNETKIENDV